MNRNMSRMTNYANRLESWKDWDYVSFKAIGLGRQDLVDANTPKPGYGWRRIDACTEAIRAEYGWPPVYEMRDADATSPASDTCPGEPSGDVVAGAPRS